MEAPKQAPGDAEREAEEEARAERKTADVVGEAFKDDEEQGNAGDEAREATEE